MLNSSLTERQAEIYKDGNCTASRRFLTGSKKPPFELRMKTLFDSDENVTHYAVNGDYWIKVIDGDKLFHSVAPLNSLKLPAKIISISPILETSYFSFVDENKSVMIITSSARVFPIPNTNTFHQSGYHTVIIKGKLYIFISTLTNTLKIFEISPAGTSIRINLKAEWVKALPNNSCITTFSYGDQWYLAASDFVQAYFCNFDVETFATPKFTPIAEILNYTLNNSQMLLQFVLASQTHLVWMRVDTLIIIPISKLVTRQSTAEVLMIPMKRITDLMHAKSMELFTVKAAIPFFLTRQHIVIVTYSSQNLQRETDIIAALSLETGKIAMLRPLNFVNPTALTSGPNEESFALVTRQGIIVSDFSNETSLTSVVPINIIKARAVKNLEPNKYVYSEEILLDLLRQNKYDDAVKLIVDLVSKKSFPKKQVIILHILIYELEILSAIMNGKLFVPYAICDDISVDILQKAIYLVQMRAFSDVSRSIKTTEFSENWRNMPSAIRVAINCGQYKDAIPTILASNAEYLLTEIGLRSAGTLISCMTSWINNTKLLERIIPKTFPFVLSKLGADPLIILLKQMLINGKNNIVSWLLWELSLEQNASKYDNEVANLLQKTKPVFSDFLELHDALTRGGMPESAKVIYTLVSDRNNKENIFSKKHLKDEENAIPERAMTVDEIVAQLESVLSSVTKCTQIAADDSHIIEKDKLINVQDVNEGDVCCVCQRKVKNGNCYSFACGHCFDEKCLIEKMIDALDDEQSNRLKFLSETNSNSKELEEILSQDCPLCGIISTNVIAKPIVVSDIGLSLF